MQTSVIDSLDEHVVHINNSIAIDAIKQLNQTKRPKFDHKNYTNLKLIET